jgi:hypothetical protein
VANVIMFVLGVITIVFLAVFVTSQPQGDQSNNGDSDQGYNSRSLDTNTNSNSTDIPQPMDQSVSAPAGLFVIFIVVFGIVCAAVRIYSVWLAAHIAGLLRRMYIAL